MRSPNRRLSICTAIAAAVLLGTAAGVPASAATAPASIGPNQYFTGEVNGTSVEAVIRVACSGPAGGTGHPIAGQSVDVVPAPAATSSEVGYTGGSADHIGVGFDGVSVGRMLMLKSYGAKAEIPAGQSLPCTGTGLVALVPTPADATARAAMVSVRYETIAY